MIRKKVNIGDIIKQKMQERGMSISRLARLASCSRGALHGVFERQSIDTDFLQVISEILEYDFFSCYQDNNKPKTICRTYRFQIELTEKEIPENLIRKIYERKNTVMFKNKTPNV